MDELASIYILKNFEESTKNGSFWLKNKYFIVEHNYVESLLSIFSITKDVAIATLDDVANKLGYKLFILNYRTIVEDLGDLESIIINKSSNFSKKDFDDFVLELIDVVIKRKLECVPLQKYDVAGFYRDIEVDLKKIYHPSLHKNNNVVRMTAFLDAVESAKKTAAIVKRDNPHLR